MQIFRKLSIILLMPMLLVSTAHAAGGQDSRPHYISQIQVICHRGSTTISRAYIQPHKMEEILNYLRILDCNGNADTDPERIVGDSFVITLYDSSGQRQIYRQRANRFLSKNSHPWETIDTEQAKRLYPLILSMLSDV